MCVLKGLPGLQVMMDLLLQPIYINLHMKFVARVI